MPLSAWSIILVVTAVTALFTSFLANSLATGIGAFIVLGIVFGTFWYLFGADVTPYARKLLTRKGQEGEKP